MEGEISAAAANHSSTTEPRIESHDSYCASKSMGRSRVDGNKLKIVDKENPDKYWQTSKASVRERNEFMFNNALLSDVKFKAGKKDGNCEVLNAHKYVLATASPVFFAMLYGDLAENSDVIEVNDSDPDSFAEFLRYIYCDHANLSPNNVLGILYLAKKYLIPYLVNECVSYLMDNITVDNVLEVLQCALCFCEEKLEKHCWWILSRKTLETIQSESFLEIDRSLLASILEKDNLTINEIDLFKAVKSWSEKECTRTKLDVNPENQKKVLENIISLIRFPVMSAKEFAEGPARSGLLNIEDIRDIFIYLNAGIMESLKFSLCQRGFHPFVCSRYRKTMKNYLWRYDERDIDSIRFKVDEAIHFAGVGLYGSPCGGEYSVMLTLTDDEEFTWRKETTFTCPPDPYFNSVDDPKIYDIIFDEPIRIKDCMFYTLSLLVQGPPSFGGDDGQSEVIANGVTFHFENSGDSTNGTSFDEGQIPTLLFYF